MRINKKLIMKAVAALAIMLTAHIGVSAENTSISPYSRYGFGSLSDNATSAQRALGGVGYAMNSGRQINVMNPASYAAMDSLTFLFDMGMDITTLWTSDGTTSEQHAGGGLDYITMQFPIGKRMGASIGLLPYSSVGYSFGTTIDNGYTSRTGTGGLSQLYAGFGGSPFKGFGLGFNFSYLFGTTSNDVYATTITSSTSLFERVFKVRDWHLELGAQYSFNIGRKNRITAGLVYSLGKDLRGETYGIFYDTSVDDATPDTIGMTSLKGKFSLPEKWGAGINYEWNNRLMIEADFTYQPWKDAKYTAIEDFEVTEYSNRWKAGLGVQYQPDPRGSYLRRVQYRVGGFYNNDYVMVRGNNVRDYGVSLGFGLPVPGYKTIINLGVEYRHRQTTPVNLIKENYLNITIGVNFNEMWFRKSKIY